MNSLTKIANKYNTDKGTAYTGPMDDIKILGGSIKHGYTEFYEPYIRKYKGKHPVILDIGVEHGGSLQMFNEYFKGDCEIYCIDINPYCQLVAESIGDNIHFIEMDQSKIQCLDAMRFFIETNDIEFDFIIDDGSHKSKDQMLTIWHLHQYLKKDGFYIIEDLHTAFMKDFNEDVGNDEFSPLSFFIKMKDYKHYSKSMNDTLHERFKTAVLFANKNIPGVQITNIRDDDQICLTMIIFFK